MDTTAILSAIDQLIADLAEPTTAEEQREGWSDAVKARWRSWFVELNSTIAAGEPLPAGWGILRAMDFDGIDPTQSSRLTLQASRIGELIDQRC
jgi:hypothetical protein